MLWMVLLILWDDAEISENMDNMPDGKLQTDDLGDKKSYCYFSSTIGLQLSIRFETKISSFPNSNLSGLHSNIDSIYLMV